MSEKPSQQIQIKAKDGVLEGKYANMAQISHTKEEFVFDFMNVFPPQGTLTSRVIMSPGHAKRLLRALQENVAKFESQHGPIKESDEPRTQFGFPIE